MSKKKKRHKYREAAVRKDAMEQGFYDGRFRKRVVPNKKKKEQIERARKDKNFE